MRAPAPQNEKARLAALANQEILDTAPEGAFDDVAQLAQLICATPMALVSFVAEDRQWFKARCGFALTELPRDVSFCAHALHDGKPLVVPDATADPRFADNPLVQGDPNIRFYAGVPICVDGGAAVGTLCVLDRVPRTLTAAQLEALSALARRVETEMRLRKEALAARKGAEPSLEIARASERPDWELITGDMVAERYCVERLIGSGGMGRVYRAIDATNDRIVALKVMTALALSDAESIERFAREARALKRVESDHVAMLLDAGNLSDGAPFFVMEHLVGCDLAMLQKGERLSVGRVADLAAQACLGIAAVHEAGIVHRDVKPSNFFLAKLPDGTPTLKVLDFGISLLSDEHGAERTSSRLTTATAILGSPPYMSPEQMLSSRDVDASTDIWALGVVIFEMLSKAHPFDGESMTERCANIFTKKPYTLRERGAEVPAGLEAVVLGCLAREKERRWKSARELSEAFSRFR